jgi:sulfur transfer complex TusBCD TusB component (DsrH family)
MRVLHIIESAYRGTLVEQDDTIIWLAHCLRSAGAELSVLLKDNAVNYVLLGEDCSGLRFGAWQQTRPPQIAQQLRSLIAKQVRVHVVGEHMVARGIESAPRIPEVKVVARAGLPGLFEEHDQVWHW